MSNFVSTANIINHIIKNNYSNNPNYLEIGVWYGETIKSVNTINKDGVDPEQYCKSEFVNYKITSDEFFENHITKKYDIIFIDGLHTAYQVTKDIHNSIKNLNNNGWIVIDDVFPHSENEQERLNLRKSGPQTGDVWKAIYEMLDTLVNISESIYFVKDIARGNLIIKLKNSNTENITINDSIPVCNVDGWYNGNDAEWNKYDYTRDFGNYLKKMEQFKVVVINEIV